MTHAGHRAYKKVDQRNRPCDPSAFAVDNYKCDSKNGTMAPDGTVTCYSLFPINSYTKKQAIKDEKVRDTVLKAKLFG